MNWQSLLLSAEGRIGRRDFWLGAAALICVGLVVSIIPILGAVASLALLLPWACLAAKRLHDFGRSGWLALVAAVPAAAAGALALFTSLAAANLATVGVALAGAGVALMVSTLASLVALAFLLWAGLKPSDPAPNAYGPVPTPVFTL